MIPLQSRNSCLGNRKGNYGIPMLWKCKIKHGLQSQSQHNARPSIMQGYRCAPIWFQPPHKQYTGGVSFQIAARNELPKINIQHMMSFKYSYPISTR